MHVVDPTNTATFALTVLHLTRVPIVFFCLSQPKAHSGPECVIFVLFHLLVCGPAILSA